ncbi:TBC1 domain family member 25 [Hypsibius exemplaris]|uniref:TBC1 domain family member 25 n=1 Tax=Hypsibius exemplaris TaxID=2072580 RepID=A0A1W0X944_HYPEX|nr:TBC1 domain family member 25 [Hypsibius exemplaris]
MSDVFALHEMADAVKVKIKKCDGPNSTPVYKKFCIDPRITSFEVLRKLLSKAFEIKGEFSISYFTKDDNNKPSYLSLLSDWDLDAALLSCAADPYLRLKVDLQPFEDGYDDWDIICPVDVPEKFGMPHPPPVSPSGQPPKPAAATLSTFGRTIELVQKALQMADYEKDENRFTKPPMSDTEYRNFLDSEGRLVRPLEFRRSVFLGGVDHNLRKYVWRLILNVFPDGMTGQERLDYMKRKSAEYTQLRDGWKKLLSDGEITHQLQFITNLVRKDVLRTDRGQKYFAGSDENRNVLALFNILTTYAMNHPSVSYCQGMSDLASPLLVVMKDEAHAYICFCGLMKRLKRNFRSDGLSMTTKFDHLRKLLSFYDPEFYNYLVINESDDLLFCYRWLLVELKREFSFDDALRALEVIWSSLPPDPPVTELDLAEPEFLPSSSDEDHASLVRGMSLSAHESRMRDAGSSKTSSGHSSGRPSKRGSVSGDGDDQSSHTSSSDDSSEFQLLNCSLTENLEKQLAYLDVASRTRNPSDGGGIRTRNSSALSRCSEPSPRSSSVMSMEHTLTDSKVDRLALPTNTTTAGSTMPRNNSDLSDGGVRSVSSAEASPTLERIPVKWPHSIMDSGVDASVTLANNSHGGRSSILPPPHELGDGNPFLMFVCLTILLQHRDIILSNRMQHHFELAMHFDKMIKRHNLPKILMHARSMFADYLKAQQREQQLREEDELGSDDAHMF